MASACSSPARSCQPSPTTDSPCVMTQPTRGFGVVVNRPFSARASARRIIASSNAEYTGLALLLSRGLDLLHRFAEIVGGFEAAVHRGEADVGDLVELRQLADHEVAHPAGRHLGPAQPPPAVRPPGGAPPPPRIPTPPPRMGPPSRPPGDPGRSITRSTAPSTSSVATGRFLSASIM